MEILKAQAMNEGKPAEIAEKWYKEESENSMEKFA